MQVAVPPALDAVERGVLAGLEVGVGAAGVRVTGGPGVVGPAVVGLPHAGEVLLETVQEVAHHAVRRRSLVGGEAVARAQAGAHGPAGQGDQDPRLPGLVDRGLPAALDDGVGVHVPGPVVGVPDPAGELHLDLRVRAEGLLPDGLALPWWQADSVQFYLAQFRERQGEYHVICVLLVSADASGERAGVAAVTAAAHGG